MIKKRPTVEVMRNSKSKIYSDGSKNTIVCKQAVFKDSFDISPESAQNELLKFEIANQKCHNIIDYINAKQISLDEFHERRKENMKLLKKVPKSHSDEVRHDSLKRAKDSIFDYILNNEFEYFFTGTLNPDKMDSKDPKEVIKPLIKWLKNMVQRYCLSYIIIAERHKSGAIHFHGLFKADKELKLEDSGTKLYKGFKKPVSDERASELGLSDGRTVYNLKTWKFGFSTAVKLVGNRMNTAFYVTKYITKDCKKIFGKFFWHSRDLKRPQVILEDIDFDSINTMEFNGFKYVFTGGSESCDLIGCEFDEET